MLTLEMHSNTFKPYSIRRGGASWHLQTVQYIERTVFRGRWSSVTAARSYIQEGLAILAQTQLSERMCRISFIFIATLKASLQ